MENPTPIVHPNLQIAIDRLKKRYAGVQIKISDNYSYATMSDGTRMPYLVQFRAYTESSPDHFVLVYVDQLGSPPAEHRLCVSSRYIRNERHPRNEKRTTKEKTIPKLIDEYAKPYTLAERADELLSDAYSRMRSVVWKAERAEDLALKELNKTSDFMMKIIMGEEPVTAIPDSMKALVVKLREAQEHRIFMQASITRDEPGAAVQVIVFQVGERWILNVYNATTQGTQVLNFDAFDQMPDFIQQKVALLKIAPHKEVLEDIGVKVEANSYFLYGHELQQLRKPIDQDDARKESQEESNCTT